MYKKMPADEHLQDTSGRKRDEDDLAYPDFAHFKNNKLTCMLSSGIIDPSKVTRTALQNAVSVASTLITTTNAIVED